MVKLNKSGDAETDAFHSLLTLALQNAYRWHYKLHTADGGIDSQPSVSLGVCQTDVLTIVIGLYWSAVSRFRQIPHAGDPDAEDSDRRASSATTAAMEAISRMCAACSSAVCAAIARTPSGSQLGLAPTQSPAQRLIFSSGTLMTCTGRGFKIAEYSTMTHLQLHRHGPPCTGMSFHVQTSRRSLLRLQWRWNWYMPAGRCCAWLPPWAAWLRHQFQLLRDPAEFERSLIGQGQGQDPK